MITENEGRCVPLDSATSNLLELYAAKFNAKLTVELQGRECPFPPEAVEPEEIARRLLQRLMLDWFEHEVRL